MLCTKSSFAQHDSISSNSVFIELLGHGGYYSINYDKIISRTPKGFYSIRIGVSVSWTDTVQYSYKYFYEQFSHMKFPEFSIPMMINHCGKIRDNYFFEKGIGVGYAYSLTYSEKFLKFIRQNEYVLIANFGLRRQIKNGFLYKINWTPIYDFKKYGLLPYQIGASVGFSF